MIGWALWIAVPLVGLLVGALLLQHILEQIARAVGA